MKEKIIAAIKAKYPAINLSKKRLEAIAAKIETLVIDDETKIDASVEALNTYGQLDDLAKSDDTTRDLQTKLKATQKPDDTKPDSGDPAKPEDATAKMLATLLQEVQSLKADKSKGEMLTKATEKLKDVPASYWNNWSLPEKEDDLDAFAAKVTDGYNAFVKEAVDKGLKINQAPKSGVPAGGIGGDKKIPQELKNAFPVPNGQAQNHQPAARSNVINTPGTL